MKVSFLLLHLKKVNIPLNMYGFYFCAVNNKVNYLGLKEKLEKLSKLITTSMTQIGKDLKGGTLKWSGYKILFLKFFYFIYM